MKWFAAYALFLAMAASPLVCETAALPAGKVIENVVCEKDSSESYALYLPSNYTPARPWPVILGSAAAPFTMAFAK